MKEVPLTDKTGYMKGVLYSTANDPQPQMIPKMDRKWSSTVSDPQSRPQMIPWKIEGMDWILLDWLQKRTDYEMEPFSLAF